MISVQSPPPACDIGEAQWSGVKIIARRVAVSAVLAGAVLGMLVLPAQADDTGADTGVSVSGDRTDEVFPTDVFGYEDPEDFIQAYYEYKKGCTNDCQAGFIRHLVHNLV
ncbi:hypothetical protein ACFWBF_15420 [Streptomyces sp. NPDC060028]|uniref:hypothetical protein n=1 Tax=Streptomyces sp. NPDC060028 TaxID=3347041 RepID=UPI00369D914B